MSYPHSNYSYGPYGPYGSHPYYPHHHAHGYGYPAGSPGFATPPQYFYPSAPGPAPAAAATATGPTDLAAEEAAALAHLQAIQARRRAQEASTADRNTPLSFGDYIARAISEERATRAREETERAERHVRKAREQAEKESRRAKEQAEKEARRAKEQAEREAQRAKEQAAAEAQRAKEEARRAREEAHREAHRARELAIREHERARRESANAVAEARQAKFRAFMEARQRYQEQQIEARRRWVESRQAEATRLREQIAANEYAQRAAKYAREAARPHVEKYAPHIGQLNEVLSSLFGINIVPEEESKEAPAPAPEKKEEKHVEFKEPVVEEPTATKTDAAKEQPAFPDSINDILGSFLGLRVEPTSKETAAPSAPADLSGLNELLERFGLVFEPEAPAAPTPEAPVAGPSTPAAPAPAAAPAAPAPAEASSSAPKAAPAHEETPLTSFLNGVTDLPPFVRDILGNLELAWKEEATASQPTEGGKRDKGKGVAPGEKPARSTPPETSSPAESDSSTTSLSQLSTIADELSLVRDSFTFPTRLAFGPSSNTTPALLFNKTNSAYHAQANKLLQLLLAADGISSGGDREVRARRKEVVRAVEQEIQDLEKKRDAVWEEVKARRESTGEISEDEEGLSTGSAAPSVIDHEEVRDVPEEVVFHYDEPEHSEPAVPAAEETKVEGFEVPTVEEPATVAPEEHEDETDGVDRKGGKEVDKKVLDAEEFELL